MTNDPLDRLAAYRPTRSTVEAEWPAGERTRVRSTVLAAEPARSLRFHPARRHALRALAPLAAGGAVLALIAGILVATLGGSDRGGAPAAAPSAHGSGRLTATDQVGEGQYAYRYDHQIDVDGNGRPLPDGPDELRNRSWVSPDGDIVSSREGSQHGCDVFPRQGEPSMAEPTWDFLAGLPTDVDELATYLRAHVSGSTSRDEAVFVAVGDALRAGDLLATSELRAALVGVLGRTPGVTVHPDQRDFLDRPATRADFVDELNRPGEVQSMYFAPDTYQFLEERDATSDQSVPQNQPSPAYDAPPASASTPAELGGAAYIDVMVEERVVSSIPFDPADCTGLRIDGGARIGGPGVPVARPSH